jgi:hypothetical protein
MLSCKQILSAMAGLVMIAIPVSALAKHPDDGNNPRTYARHGQVFHNGWAKHQSAGEAPPSLAHRHYGEPRVAPTWDGHNYSPPSERYSFAPQPIGWADGDRHEWDDGGHKWRHHNWDDNYTCDDDGDNCHWNNDSGSRYWQNNGGYNYGAPYSWYEGPPPAGANLVQQRAWLINRRQHAMALIAQMRARGDSRGANRVVSIVRALNSRIASINRQLGYNSYSGFAPSATYGPPFNYPGASPLLTGAVPDYGNSNPYLGSTAYTGNPTTETLVSMLPLLLGAH